VATFSMPLSIDDLVGDVVHLLLGALESDISIGSFDTFQFIIIPYDENLLQAKLAAGHDQDQEKISFFLCEAS